MAGRIWEQAPSEGAGAKCLLATLVKREFKRLTPASETAIVTGEQERRPDPGLLLPKPLRD